MVEQQLVDYVLQFFVEINLIVHKFLDLFLEENFSTK
jgi:hypothetical protein